MAHENKEDWVARQERTFMKWCNNHLRKKGYPAIESIQNDFEDGVRLMQLINSLYGIALPKYRAEAKMRVHKLDNIALALKMVDDAKVKTNFLKREHLADKDLKMLLGMVWAIILDFAIKGISVEEMTAKEGLLLWCRKKTAGYKEVDPPGINNFTSNWSNGLALCALIHRHRPDLLDYSKLDKANAADNIELAFKTAESIGIPRLLDVGDLLVERPDERSVMTYISEYFHKFAAQDVKETAAKRVGRFLNFARAMEARQHDYEVRAKALLDWVSAQIQAFADNNFGETVVQAKEALEAYRNYIVTQKPPKSAEKMDVEALFAEIQTELKVNGRSAYVPPADLAPEAIDEAFGKLAASEKDRSKNVRENRYKYITKLESKISQEDLDEFEKTFNHFDADKSGKLDKLEFKAALSAIGVPFKDDAAFEIVFGSVSQGDVKVTKAQFVQYMTSIREDKDTADQIKASFAMIADQADTVSAQALAVPPLTDDDIKYLQANMPQAANGNLDYKAYVDKSFK